MIDIKKLIDMHSYRRPAFSYSEEEFIDKYIYVPNKKSYYDGYGNVIIDTVSNPSTIFSAHTDTVDYMDGKRDCVVYDEDFSILHTNKQEILGADDCAGVYILLEMIKENIPGRYIFHREEESGAKGAHWIIENTPEIFHNISSAIAFDRAGDKDIITSMVTGVTASEDFSKILSEELDGGHESARGTFTDTAFYIGHIKNCTNISVGYYDQHSQNEFLDLAYFDWLVERVKAMNWGVVL